jgi:uncharacterized protein involved in type VI secretion and phage assembly
MTAPTSASASATTDDVRFFGKYRGTVDDNADPRKIGRLRARVPEVLGKVLTGWALPALPYSGDKTGVFTVPKKGAGVWIEFEAGRVSRPIWSGCWWKNGAVPTDEGGTAATTDVKIVRSEEGLMLALHDDSKKIAVSDKDGKNLLLIEVDNGQVTVKASSKVVIEAPKIELVASATHPGVFGDELDTYLKQLVQIFNAHVHPGELAAGFLPVTPAPPVAPMTPPTPSLQSTKVTLG